MRNSTRALNWLIGGYIGLKIFGYSKIFAANPSLRILFVLAPASLLVWQALVLHRRFAQQDGGMTGQPFYERIYEEDWWRIFLILWIGHRPFASDYLLGFYAFSVLAFSLLGLLVFMSGVELVRKKRATLLVIGCLAFGYFLLSWERSTFVEHYGVPIVGDFFEKPEYHAKYRVEIAPENSNTKLQAIADIHVKGRTESDDSGEEDYFGQTISQTYTYRDVWLETLYLPNGGAVSIEEQFEPLHLGKTVIVSDSGGRSWNVRLLNEPIP